MSDAVFTPRYFVFVLVKLRWSIKPKHSNPRSAGTNVDLLSGVYSNCRDVLVIRESLMIQSIAFCSF